MALAFVDWVPGVGQPETISVVKGATTSLWFVKSLTGGYEPEFGGLSQLLWDTGTHEFILLDNRGWKWIFYDHTAYNSDALWGKLKNVTDPAGRKTQTVYGASGRMLSFSQVADGQASGYYYVYESVSGNVRLASVTLKVNGRDVRRAVFGYYGAAETHGSAGDLKVAVEEEYNFGQAVWNWVQRKHYRYYVSGAINGFEHGLKFIVGGPAYEQMLAAGIDPLQASDSEVATFADYYFEYDAEQRVTLERLLGGRQEYQFTYEANPEEPGPLDINVWNMKTTETLPDGTENRVYTDKAGQPILNLHFDPVTNESWGHYYEYDEGYRTVLHAQPSAIAAISEPSGLDYTLTVTLKPSDGLIEVWEFYDTTDPMTGAVEGRLKYRGTKKGSAGTFEAEMKMEYTTRTVGSNTIHPISAIYEFPEAGMSESLAPKKTWSYTWHTDANGDPTFQIKEETQVLPVVSIGQNGTGVSYVTKRINDIYGQATWLMNERGVITRQEYEEATGALRQLIKDVDTARLTDVPSGWSTQSGFGLHLVTDYENDEMGRVVKEMGPWHDCQLKESDLTPTAIRRVEFTVYKDDVNEVRRASGWMAGTGASPQFQTIGGVQVTQTDADGRVVAEIVATRICSCGPLTSEEELPQSGWSKLTKIIRDAWGRKRVTRDYFDIPAKGEGDEGTHYLESRFGYDSMNRENRVVDATGTIVRQLMDSRGLVKSVWMGTNDTGATDEDPSGGGNPMNNMRQRQSQIFDNGSDGGNGNLTEIRFIMDDDADHDRVSSFLYDYRNRQIQKLASDGTQTLIGVSEFNNLDRVIQVTGYHTSVVPANRTHRTRYFFDSLSRRYKTEIDGIQPGSGDITNTLTAQKWFDGAGNEIKNSEAGRTSFTKSLFDGLNRVTVRYSACVLGEPGVPTGNTNDVTTDTVTEQIENFYDPADATILSVMKRRLDTAEGAGPLQGPIGAEPRARAETTAYWPDGIGRQHLVVQYGTNGGLPVQRPRVAPKRGGTVLVSTTFYKDSGEANGNIDPLGVVTHWENDNLGRRIRLIENVAGSSDGETASRRVTEYAWHASGQLQKLVSSNATTGEQVTRWVFGTTLADSGTASNQLIRAKIYPESDDQPMVIDQDGADGVYSRLEYAYNRQGQVIQFKDADGTVHQYDYDKLGRQTEDSVITIAANLDSSVRRISIGYDDMSRVNQITSYDAASGGDIVNQVVKLYDAFGNLLEDRQSHDGAADSSTPKVTYAFSSGAGNQMRLMSLTYPDGRVLESHYGESSSIDDHFNRTSGLQVDGETDELVTYTYAGTAWQVVVGLPQPEIELTYKRQSGEPTGDGGDIYFGYDRFGRSIDIRWQKSGTPLVHLQYGFDAAGRRLWRNDLIASPEAQQDRFYGYDGLGQVISEDMGDLNVNRTAIAGVPATGSRWIFDETGNWHRYEELHEGAVTLNQPRTHDKGNRLMGIGAGAGPVRVDRAGRMIEVPPAYADWEQTRQIKWDAWNRISEVWEGGVVAKYSYDGLMRRIVREANDKIIHSYFSANWRPLEDRETDAESPGTPLLSAQFLWGVRHRDDLVRRDRSVITPGTLDETRFVLMDYFSPAAITDADGGVVERYAFNAFGLRSILGPDYTLRGNSESFFEFSFQGQFQDKETGWIDYGYRYYSPEVGRWLNKDPIEERGGINLYGMASNDPLNQVDYLGLKVTDCWPLPSTMAFKGAGWVLKSTKPIDSLGGGFVKAVTKALFTWEAAITLECRCQCYKGWFNPKPDGNAYKKSVTAIRVYSDEVDLTHVSVDIMSAGVGSIPVPSGATVIQQGVNAAGMMAEAGLSEAGSMLGNSLGGADVREPTKVTDGSWKTENPCK